MWRCIYSNKMYVSSFSITLFVLRMRWMNNDPGFDSEIVGCRYQGHVWNVALSLNVDPRCLRCLAVLPKCSWNDWIDYSYFYIAYGTFSQYWNSTIKIKRSSRLILIIKILYMERRPNYWSRIPHHCIKELIYVSWQCCKFGVMLWYMLTHFY